MPIDRDALLAQTVDNESHSYAETDAILYALAVGIGADPNDPAQLPYVYEGGPMRTVPTMAARMLNSAFIDACGLDAMRVIHAGERLELYRPLPPAADLLVDSRVVAVDGLGADAGASIEIEAEGRFAKDGTVLFTCGRKLIAHGGGIDTQNELPDSLGHRLPAREADLSCAIDTARNQALLFRLVDSMSALHVDARAARRAGYEQPVLQSRCTLGIACHAILRTICDYDFTLIRGLEALFPGPVYPGETLVTEMWQDRNIVSFRCLVASRNAVVLDHGKCTLAG